MGVILSELHKLKKRYTLLADGTFSIFLNSFSSGLFPISRTTYVIVNPQPFYFYKCMQHIKSIES